MCRPAGASARRRSDTWCCHGRRARSRRIKRWRTRRTICSMNSGTGATKRSTSATTTTVAGTCTSRSTGSRPSTVASPATRTSSGGRRAGRRSGSTSTAVSTVLTGTRTGSTPGGGAHGRGRHSRSTCGDRTGRRRPCPTASARPRTRKGVARNCCEPKTRSRAGRFRGRGVLTPGMMRRSNPRSACDAMDTEQRARDAEQAEADREKADRWRQVEETRRQIEEHLAAEAAERRRGAEFATSRAREPEARRRGP